MGNYELQKMENARPAPAVYKGPLPIPRHARSQGYPRAAAAGPGSDCHASIRCSAVTARGPVPNGEGAKPEGLPLRGSGRATQPGANGGQNRQDKPPEFRAEARFRGLGRAPLPPGFGRLDKTDADCQKRGEKRGAGAQSCPNVREGEERRPQPMTLTLGFPPPDTTSRGSRTLPRPLPNGQGLNGRKSGCADRGAGVTDEWPG
ncbi:uncharacterized protein ACOB8E_020511 [Sarcophilus harrisii]